MRHLEAIRIWKVVFFLTFFSLKLNPCNLLFKGPLNYWDHLQRLRKKALVLSLHGGIYDSNQTQCYVADRFSLFYRNSSSELPVEEDWKF